MRGAGGSGFGRRLRRTRDRTTLTQGRLADRAGLSRQWVARIEGGRAEPTVSDALALFDVLAEESHGLRLEWLLAGRGPEHGTLEDAVKRRDFARLLTAGALLGPATLPMTLDLERLASGSRIDADLLDGWASLTENYARLRPLQPPAELLPMLETHLLGLRRRVAERAGTGALWRRLLSITAGTAALAGWVSFLAERRRDARRHLDEAEALAGEADDGDALVLTLMLQADLVSAVPTGGWDGFPERARSRLDEAIAHSSRATPLALRAPLLLRSAEEHAYADLQTQSLRYLDDADREVAGARTRHHYLRPQWGQAPAVDRAVRAFRGNCLQLLGRTREAIDLLSVGDTDFPGDRIAGVTDLASAHARQGELDRSCQLLATAADLVTEHGLPVAARRIAGVRRRRLSRWDGDPAVAALDERLSLIL